MTKQTAVHGIFTGMAVGATFDAMSHGDAVMAIVFSGFAVALGYFFFDGKWPT